MLNGVHSAVFGTSYAAKAKYREYLFKWSAELKAWRSQVSLLFSYLTIHLMIPCWQPLPHHT